MLLLLLLVALPLLVHSAPVNTQFLPLDCEDIYQNGSTHSGVYTIYPTESAAGQPLQVYCDMACTEDEGQGNQAWTVIQRRFDGSVNFYRSWEDYKNGFGTVSGEHWLGLDKIFLMTSLERYQLRVDMEDFDRGHAYAQYSSFHIDPESKSYALHVSDYINGGAGDPLSSMDGRPFSTFDQNPYGNCADGYMGGFWYSCWPSNGIANPNGLYKWQSISTSTADNSILWTTWKAIPLKTITMKIRRMTMNDIQQV
ncbi:microfibril-associated glycoprotein 4-like [Clarias gariepinus]|uniref:microfibril-associated glycoprotein 4-like n=1 Tax=Clarias gariepinus TaxID=13013 RepID=UPI00234E3016|nr:microfibril-associated glycoprotein 4-like [Clarias gariepinus]XP_053332655.1 microfibril-associated glycoprotein 4-like [Clarias gariepinus]